MLEAIHADPTVLAQLTDEELITAADTLTAKRLGGIDPADCTETEARILASVQKSS
nr:hypothetical protein [Bacilli bacterium]